MQVWPSAAPEGSLAQVQWLYERTLKRLSSGLRVTQAADDPAGFATSELLDSKNRVNRRALLNIEDGRSLLTTMDGALAEQQGLVKRLKELTVQAASETLGSPERNSIAGESAQILDELDRIASRTAFQTRQLLLHPQDPSSPTLSDTPWFSSAPRPRGSATQTLVPETFTLTHISETPYGSSFSVNGATSGAHAVAYAGTPYVTDAGTAGQGAGLQFTLAAGAYTPGATIQISVARSGTGTLAENAFFSNVPSAGYAVYDLNADDRPEIVFEGDRFRVHWNSGSGAFPTQTNVGPPAASLGSASFVDADADGDRDAISTNGTTSWYLSTFSAGAFGNPIAVVDYGAVISGGTAVDLNGDGAADIVSGNTTSFGVSLNHGDGTFGAFSTTTGITGGEMVLADVNGDERPDHLMKLGASIEVRLNDRSGAFGTPTVYSGLPNDMDELAVADVNGDGANDLITVRGNPTGTINDRTIGVRLNDGNGTFLAENRYSYDSANDSGPNALAMADIDADGDLDAIIGMNLDLNVVRIALNDGNGIFTQGPGIATTARVNEGVEVADLNGDGGLEIVAEGTNGFVVINHDLALTAIAHDGHPGPTNGDAPNSPDALSLRLGPFAEILLPLLDTSVSGLDLGGASWASPSAAQNGLESINNALDQLAAHRATLGALLGRLDSAQRSIESSIESGTAALSRLRDADHALEIASLAKTTLQLSVASALRTQWQRLNRDSIARLLASP